MVDKSQAKQQIQELVDKYNKSKTKWQKISESETKSKFLEPLLEYLGWDVKGDEFPDEVIKEERIQRKRADYTLRINGVSKLIVEAKAIKEDLDRDDYAEQAINYAYNKAVSWAVLTDFEGLKIFYADEESTRPFRNIQLANIDSFNDDFEDIWLLSKESFLSSELDKKAEREGRRKRRINIGEQLFQDLNNWREILSKDIARNYGNKYQDYEIDEIVQRIIDRLIFIRKTEDIEIEENQLLKLTRTSSKHYYKQLKKIFRYYNEQYNSKLFGESSEDFHECDEIDVSDEVILKVINGLYAPQGRFVKYDFAAIDADVLGNIYEQYLSHILKKTPKRAKLKEGRAHRKEQGIYYTPTYIVNYIIRNTVNDILKNKKVKSEEIRILDPACGSGSFLLKAFDFLNEYYNKKEGRGHQAQLDEIGLFTRKARILKSNIFGVDLDTKAVEIAQLNLLLKLAERKHRLPTLKENIKCGNSLIDNHQVAGDKAFKWDEKFQSIMANGGFDVVIGNPPYVRQEELGEFKPYFEAHYHGYKGTADLLIYFFEKGISLLRDGGYFGFIASNKFIRSDYGVNLRKFILENCTIEKIIDFGELPVFKDASTFPCIFIFRKGKARKNHKFLFCGIQTLEFGNLEDYIKENGFYALQSTLGKDGWRIARKGVNEIIEKMNKQGIQLKKYADVGIYRGILTGFNEAFVINKEIKDTFINADPKNKEIILPTLRGKDIGHYGIKDPSLFLIVTRNGINVPKDYPVIFDHLSKFKEPLIKRADQGEHWYNLRACAYYDEFEKPKIIYGDISLQNRFTIDSEGYYPLKTCFIIPKADKYLLALLNSKLFEFYMRQTFPILGDPEKGGRILHGTTYMNKLPIKEVTEKEKKPLVELVDKMISLNNSLNEIGDKKTDERTRIEEEIKKTDAEIDELVYQIYGLTKEEINIFEGNTSKGC